MSKSQEHNSVSTTSIINLTGSCHCGAVTFEAKAPADATVLICNCSICKMTGFQHLIVNHDQFKLLSGEDKLTQYQFNTKQAKHLFCIQCGVKSFYQPRSHPESWSININCIDNIDPNTWQTQNFDGQNWEQAKQELT